MSNKINITIDGRRVQTEERTMLLQILQDLGIYVPTLCHHPSLTPSGACRLCVVEVSKESWKGSSKIVTSCLYPAEDGLIVNTRSADVLKTRRSLLELYLAQCPASEEIKALARLEGIDETPFTVGDQQNKCVLCGLCIRVCQDCGPGAISTLGRGIDKFIAPNPDGVAEDCTGCRACAYICPTGAIPLEQNEGTLKIWNRDFKIPVCSVINEKCRGCAICEEVCPFAVPRSTMASGGETLAYISPTACLGCGICAGACPTGAICQETCDQTDDLLHEMEKRNLKGKDLIFTCQRTSLEDEKGEGLRVSCIGAVELPLILKGFALGARSIAMCCRDRGSCPYSAGGDIGEKRIGILRELLQYYGLDQSRLTLLSPEPGREGPRKSWQEYINSVNEVEYMPPTEFDRKEELTGFDEALFLMDQLTCRQLSPAVLPVPLAKLFVEEDEGKDSYDLLYLDRLPAIYLLFKFFNEESKVFSILEQISGFLKDKGFILKPLARLEDLASHPRAKRVIAFSRPPAALTESDKQLITLDQLSSGPLSDLGQFTFMLDQEKRRLMVEKLESASGPYVCRTIEEYLQYQILLRTGSWLKTLKPVPRYALKALGDEKLELPQLSDQYRIKNHPILNPLSEAELNFTFNGIRLKARKNEVITSALYAAGIHIFGHHSRDGGAQGIYCVNGQCSQCMVIVDGKPVKGCMTPVREGMSVQSVEGLPELAFLDSEPTVIPHTPLYETDVLVIGGGPAGISAAIELGKVGVDTLLVDDKQELGGKLSLQTHNFFGSVEDCYAGSRGMHIGEILVEELECQPTVKIWLNSTVVGVFSDKKFGIAGNGKYRLVKANKVLFTTGAREKSLAFPGADLPGVYGAGAFQTLVNRDLIRCAERLFIVGGGNVGLIGAYHALQAGIDVVGLVEALPRCGGYKVHEDKIKRFGVPVWTSHTVLRIEGNEKVERVVTAALDENFKPLAGSEKVFNVDTVLIAVGLSPVNELYEKAREYGLDVYAAGDADEIAEASAAIFSGKITGRRIAQSMGIDLPIPSDWEAFGETLKQHAAESKPFLPEKVPANVYPLIRCMQEIPCNPCTEACPKNCITMKDSILALPEFSGECIGCSRCVLACPGLAINLVVDDYDPQQEKALLIMPFEFVNDLIPIGREVTTTNMEGQEVGKGKVIAYKEREAQNSRRLLMLEVPYAECLSVAGFRVREIDEGEPLSGPPVEADDPIVCRCERVRKSEIVKAIRDGVRDLNQLKALLRTGLGGCNGKTCTDLILRIYREEGVPLDELTMPTHRPLVAEVHLGDFIAEEAGGEG